MNTKERGDVAVGQAISYYLSSGYEVCLPIGDKRSYDFIAEKENVLERVQVKFAGLYARAQQCIVGLRITGGNQSYNYARKYPNDAFDTLFVYTHTGQKYRIPWKELQCRNQVNIEHAKYRRYRIE